LKSVLKFPSKLKTDQSYDPAMSFVSKNTKKYSLCMKETPKITCLLKYYS
jgi:hypothetical protein